MSAKPLRIGTRASALALWQVRHVQGLLAAQRGARRWSWCTSAPPGRADRCRCGRRPAGVLAKEIDRALLEGSVDLAVHS